jgi:hypothetical protein
MRRGVVALVVCLVLGLAPSAFAVGNSTVRVTKDHDNNVTLTVNKRIMQCLHPKTGELRVFCFTMTNNEFLMFGPSGIIWTPSHTEDFYDNVTGNHFTGQDPGTLDQPL